MAPKRTTTAEAENSPDPKRRATRAPNSTRKPVRIAEDPEPVVAVVEEKKKRSHKKKEPVSTTEEGVSPVEPSSPVAAKKRGRPSRGTTTESSGEDTMTNAPVHVEDAPEVKQDEVEEIHEVHEEITSVTPALQTVILSPPSAKKTPKSKAATPAPASVHSSPIPAATVPTPQLSRTNTPAHNNTVVVVPALPTNSDAMPLTPAFHTAAQAYRAEKEEKAREIEFNHAVEVLRAPPSAAPLKSYESEGLVDESEILNIWNQTWRAFIFCSECVVPFFLGITLYYYAQGKYSGSQQVASVGIVFAAFLVLILGTYLLAVLPFVLISRALTCLVSDTPLTTEEQRETNLYARMFLFFTLLAGIALIFTHI